MLATVVQLGFTKTLSAVKIKYIANHCTFYRQGSVNSRKLPLDYNMLNCYDTCRKIYLYIYISFIYNEGDEWSHVTDYQPTKSLYYTHKRE